MHIISVEGYKAFHGDMLITPANPMYSPFVVQESDWLYKPDTDCWYANGSSYPAQVCKIMDKDVLERDE